MERIRYLKHLIEAIEDDLQYIKQELDELQEEEVQRQNRGNPEQRGNAQRGQQRGQTAWKPAAWKSTRTTTNTSKKTAACSQQQPTTQ